MFLENTIGRIRLPFLKEKKLYSAFFDILGFYPKNIDYYKEALMHKSAQAHNKKGKPMNNERLEFLGDAILDAVVGDVVYRHFERKGEGFLTNTRSKIVQREMLNKLAVIIGLDKLVQFSSRSMSHNSYMYGNAFEALVGAVYLDRGYDYCMRFMTGRILEELINIDKVAYKEINFKSKLIEWGQKNKVNISFDTADEKVDNSASPKFVSTVLLEQTPCGKGTGFSKKESQQLAAKSTLEMLRKNPKILDDVFATRASRQNLEEAPAMMEDDISKEVDLASLTPEELEVFKELFGKKEQVPTEMLNDENPTEQSVSESTEQQHS